MQSGLHCPSGATCRDVLLLDALLLDVLLVIATTAV